MANQEQFLDCKFPEKGINLAVADIPTDEDIEPGLTTDVGQNVRWFESLSERGRGGQRSGLSRYIDERVNGAAAIQMLNTVVRTDGNALDWEFQAEEFRATGLYLGLDLTGVDGNDQPTGGGGGFQPSESFSENRTRMSLSVDDTTQPINGTSIVTATVTDAAGAPLSGQTVRIITSRGGAGGDEAGGVTNASGIATFEVTSDRAETIKYLGKVEDSSGKPVTRSRNAVSVEYGGIAFVQARTALYTIDPPGAVVTLEFNSNVTAGNLLFVQEHDWILTEETTGISAVSDSQGNTYTRIGDMGFGFAVWWAIAGTTGPCTLSLTYPQEAGIAATIPVIAEYSGVNATSPIGPVVSNTDLGTAWTTTPITVTTSSMIVGIFRVSRIIVAEPVIPTLTPDAGFTERLEDLHTDGSAIFQLKLGLYDKGGVSADAAVTVTASDSYLFTSFGFALKP